MAGVGWGLLAPFSKLTFGIEANGVRFDASTLTVARAVWPLPVFALIVYLSRPRGTRPSRGELLEFSLAAVLVGFGLNYLYQVAVQHTSAAHVVLLQGFAPLALAAVEALAFRAPLDGPRRLALALGMAGVVCVALARGGGSGTLVGDAIMALWIAVFAAYTIVTRRLLRTYSPPFVIAVTWGGGFALVALAGARYVPVSLAHTLATPELAGLVLAGIVAAAAVLAPAAHALSVRLAGVTVATAGSQYGVIATGLLLSHQLLGEALGAASIAGATLLLLGLACTLLPARSPAA